MGEPEKIQIESGGANPVDGSDHSAVDRLRDKAKRLKGPRGKYRCRKCHELPCVCVDPKQSTPAKPVVATSASVTANPPTPLFTEKASKRLLEASFGIPVVLTNCKLWALTDEEADELAKPTTDVLNEFVTVDPKWVAVTILSVSLGSVMARKAVLYSAWKRQMQIQLAHERQARPMPPKSEIKMEVAEEPETNGHTPRPGPSVDINKL